MTTTEPVVIDAGGHRITGISSTTSNGNLPLIVALPGGSYTSHYFDVPGHSLFDTAAANGFDVVALDRPGYGGSEPLPEVTFAGNASVLDAAIGQLWDERGGDRPGAVVIAHSIGAAFATGAVLAAVVAVERRRVWALVPLAIAVSGAVLFRSEGMLFVLDLFNILASYALFLALGRAMMISEERRTIGWRWIGLPLYWMMISVAAWRAALELPYKPFFWDKTPHRPANTREKLYPPARPAATSGNPQIL